MGRSEGVTCPRPHSQETVEPELEVREPNHPALTCGLQELGHMILMEHCGVGNLRNQTDPRVSVLSRSVMSDSL